MERSRRFIAIVLTWFAVLMETKAAVSTPVISPTGSVFSSNVTVTLSATAGQVRYTTDGSEPGTNSPLYAAPLLFTNSVLLKARAFNGATPSDTAAAAFTGTDTNLAGFNSTLPLVVIHTFGHGTTSPSNVACRRSRDGISLAIAAWGWGRWPWDH